jgi:hypothetical protein
VLERISGICFVFLTPIVRIFSLMSPLHRLNAAGMRSTLSAAAFAVTVLSARAFSVGRTAAPRPLTRAVRMASSSRDEPAEVGRMNVHEFQAILTGDRRQGFQIIDVREANELDMVVKYPFRMHISDTGTLSITCSRLIPTNTRHGTLHCTVTALVVRGVPLTPHPSLFM